MKTNRPKKLQARSTEESEAPLLENDALETTDGSETAALLENDGLETNESTKTEGKVSEMSESIEADQRIDNADLETEETVTDEGEEFIKNLEKKKDNRE